MGKRSEHVKGRTTITNSRVGGGLRGVNDIDAERSVGTSIVIYKCSYSLLIYNFN